MKKVIVLAVVALMSAVSTDIYAASDDKPEETKFFPIAYDEIGKQRFLITMAREYYGNGDFWPYIYLENEARFGHPDRITPGTMVVVPDLRKYGVDPKSAADAEKARQLAKDIYSRSYIR